MENAELSTSHPVAKKNYCCGWCGELIKIKEKHFKRVYVCENKILTMKLHLKCKNHLRTYPSIEDLIEGRRADV